MTDPQQEDLLGHTRGSDAMQHLAREMGRTIRFALESNVRTVRLISISGVPALTYLVVHLVN